MMPADVLLFAVIVGALLLALGVDLATAIIWLWQWRARR
jgi:hypothetical protein